MDNQWSIWLCPDPSEQSSIQQLVNECCYRFKSSPFASHVTLFGRVDADPETTFSYLSDCVRGLGSISLNMRDFCRAAFSIFPVRSNCLNLQKKNASAARC